MAANGVLGTKRDAYKCLVDTWKAVTSLPAAAVVTYLVEIHLLVWWTFRVEPAVNRAVSPGHVESIWVFLQARHCILPRTGTQY